MLDMTSLLLGKGYIAKDNDCFNKINAFRVWLEAKLYNKWLDARSATAIKDSFHSIAAMCAKKYGWSVSAVDFSLEEIEACMWNCGESNTKEERSYFSIILDRQNRVRSLRDAIVDLTGASTGMADWAYCCAAFSELPAVKAITDIVWEGNPAERLDLLDQLRYVSINCAECLLLMPDCVLGWFCEPYGVFQQLSRQSCELVNVLRGAINTIPCMHEWFYDIHRHSFGSYNITGTVKDKSECANDLRVDKYLFTSKEYGETKESDMQIEESARHCSKVLVADKDTVVDTALDFVKDIPFASVQNCSTSEELYTLLMRYKELS